MSNNTITKNAIAESFKDLLLNKPLCKITIKDICELCGLSRNTFYYHFKDKYDLVVWIFNKNMLENVNSFNDPSKLIDSFCKVCKCMYNNRKFYLACFQYIGQNSLYEYLFDFYYELFLINIDIKYSDSNLKLNEQDLMFLAKFKASSLVGVILIWVKEGMKDNYIEYFEKFSINFDIDLDEFSKLDEFKSTKNNLKLNDKLIKKSIKVKRN